jgi:predicted adenine nucleotide alpha hydrolase (AANH) superfamily ATPase
VEGFYFNPNIHPFQEYDKRRAMLDNLKQIFDIKITQGPYAAQEWFSRCEKYSDEPEGGKRCLACYRLRLEETFRMTEELGFDLFSSTLTISPHKDSRIILELGVKVGKNKFLAIDFKKNNGFTKTCQLAKNYSFYRQNYCGCVYSIRSQRTDFRSRKSDIGSPTSDI